MIEERAIVVDVHGDQIWVEAQRQSVCGQCAAQKGCGSSVLQKVLGNKRTRMRVLSRISVSPGDHVVVGVNEDVMVKGSLLVYMLPLMLLVIFGLFGELLAKQLLVDNRELFTAAFAVLGLFVSVIFLRTCNRRLASDDAFQATILRRELFPTEIASQRSP